MSEYRFKLIDSTYTAEDAREVMLSLVNDKIKFLNLKVFSLKEMNRNIDTSHQENRIRQLKKEFIKLHESLESALEEGADIAIDCEVKFRVLDPVKTKYP